MGQNSSHIPTKRSYRETKGTVAAIVVRIRNNRVMAIKFKTEFLEMIPGVPKNGNRFDQG